MPIDYTAPFNNALRNWVDSARTGYLVRQDQADRQNAIAETALAAQYRNAMIQKQQFEMEQARAEQLRQDELEQLFRQGIQPRNAMIGGGPMRQEFGGLGGQMPVELPPGREEAIDWTRQFAGSPLYDAARDYVGDRFPAPEPADYTFNPEAGMLIPDRPGLPAQPVAGYAPPPKKDQFIDWGHGQKRNMATGEIVRVPTASTGGGGPEKTPTGLLSKGYRLDADGNAVVIPNGPADRKLRQEKSKSGTSLRALEVSADNLDRNINSLLEMEGEGAERIFGLVGGYTPNLTSGARNAQARLNAIVNQVAVRALNDMRAASATGGAVGNVTEKEWPILQSQISSLERAQDWGQAKLALQEVQATLQRVRSNAYQAYEENYGEPFGNAEKPKSPPSADGWGIRRIE